MRRAVITELANLAERDERIVLLTGDLGFTVVEEFADRHPRRFYNAGVAEQNMVGMATGLAEAGYLPFVYSIATFATMRPFEFIRNGPVLHGLPVRILGVGGGFEYGTAGPTHHALEDLALARLLPGLMVVAPCDHRQAVTALRETWSQPGPVYLRLGKNELLEIPGLDGRFQIGAAEHLGQGSDVLVVATGAISDQAARAAGELRRRGVDAGLAVLATLQPVDSGHLAAMLSGYDLVATVEAHFRSGGLGSLVAENVADRGAHARVVRFGVDGFSDGRSGSEDFMNRAHGLTAEQIADGVCDALGAIR
jgi:transketolase